MPLLLLGLNPICCALEIYGYEKFRTRYFYKDIKKADGFPSAFYLILLFGVNYTGRFASYVRADNGANV